MIKMKEIFLNCKSLDLEFNKEFTYAVISGNPDSYLINID